MTLGIRPEHIGLTSQAEGGVPLVMDTLEMLGADNLAHGRWGEQKWWCVWRIRSARKQAARCGCTCRKIICTFLTVKQDNEYEQLALSPRRRPPRRR
jgi:sn-glycerol 3-phosphate transport system ATP-binding protein